MVIRTSISEVATIILPGEKGSKANNAPKWVEPAFVGCWERLGQCWIHWERALQKWRRETTRGRRLMAEGLTAPRDPTITRSQRKQSSVLSWLQVGPSAAQLHPDHPSCLSLTLLCRLGGHSSCLSFSCAFGFHFSS